MERILITGALGFIGSHFLRFLCRIDDVKSVYSADLDTYAANAANVGDVMGRGKAGDLPCELEHWTADIRDEEEMERIFDAQKPTVVLNFAAETHVDRSIDSAAEFVRTNVDGVRVLLDLSLAYGVEMFVQVSTDEVYGSLDLDQRSSREEDRLLPNSPYSASKAGAELLARSYWRTHGLPVVVTRGSNTYGPMQYPEKLIPVIVRQAMADEPIPVYAKGENVRDWLHVHDHCVGILLAARFGTDGAIYNIGGGNEMTNISLVRKILSIMGKPESLISYVGDRPGHDLRYSIDCARAREELQWIPRVDFEEGLRETVSWYQENPGWWD
jgi:dTDP-glucose 4,6-dehydratase